MTRCYRVHVHFALVLFVILPHSASSMTSNRSSSESFQIPEGRFNSPEPTLGPFGPLFGRWEDDQRMSDVFLYNEPPRVHHWHDYYCRFDYCSRVRTAIPRVYIGLMRFYNLLIDEFYRYQTYDHHIRRALLIYIQETAVLLGRVSFAVSQFSLAPFSWFATLQLNRELVGISQVHSQLFEAFRALRHVPRYQMAVWRNFRLFF